MAIPDCGEGEIPVVEESGTCWTGECTPPENCHYVTDCDHCTDDQACVRRGSTPPYYTCVEMPAACNGTPTCECMGSTACHDAYELCHDDDGGLYCDCPTC
jgi:hypothetical protein